MINIGDQETYCRPGGNAANVYVGSILCQGEEKTYTHKIVLPSGILYVGPDTTVFPASPSTAAVPQYLIDALNVYCAFDPGSGTPHDFSYTTTGGDLFWENQAAISGESKIGYGYLYPVFGVLSSGKIGIVSARANRYYAVNAFGRWYNTRLQVLYQSGSIDVHYKM